jgi:hypothetical protein
MTNKFMKTPRSRLFLLWIPEAVDKPNDGPVTPLDHSDVWRDRRYQNIIRAGLAPRSILHKKRSGADLRSYKSLGGVD